MTILIKITESVLKKTAGCGTIKDFYPMGALNAELRATCIDLQQNCAISDAVAKIFPGAITNVDHIIIPNSDKLICLPEEAEKFIAEFDKRTFHERLEMKPISFEIEVPSEVIDQIGIGEVYRVLSESKTLELVSIR